MGSTEDAQFLGWHWRNSMKVVRFFNFDARAGGAMVLVLVHFRTWTVTLAVALNIIFWLLERKGLTFKSALRSLRVWFIGKKRPAQIWTARRNYRDTGCV